MITIVDKQIGVEFVSVKYEAFIHPGQIDGNIVHRLDGLYAYLAGELHPDEAPRRFSVDASESLRIALYDYATIIGLVDPKDQQVGELAKIDDDPMVWGIKLRMRHDLSLTIFPRVTDSGEVAHVILEVEQGAATPMSLEIRNTEMSLYYDGLCSPQRTSFDLD